MIAGSRLVSPRPHTKRGRTTTVSRPSPFAARTTSSARAFEDGYSDGESGWRGAVSSTFTSGCPAISAASVPTCTSRRTPAFRQASTTLPRALHVQTFEVGRIAEVLDLGGGVEGDLGSSAPARSGRP